MGASPPLLWRLMAGAVLLCCVPRQAEGQGLLPVLPVEHSVFSADGPGEAVRQLVFNLPDASWTPLVDPSFVHVFVNPYGLNTNFPSGGQTPWFALVSQSWTAPAKPELTRDCPLPDPPGGVETAHGNFAFTLAVSVRMVVMAESTLESELGLRILPLESNPNIAQYSSSPATVSFHANAGRFSGQSVPLRGVMVYGQGLNPGNDPEYKEAWTGDLFVALNWGTDPLGNREYMLLRFTMDAEADTDDPICLPLKDVCQNYFSQPSVQPAFTPKWQALLQGVFDVEHFYLQGAVPELLFLYDFSGKNTVDPGKTVLPGLLDAATVIPVPYQPYTNVFKFINQYDAGIPFHLPIRYDQAGGNACGPTSLTMAINSRGFTANDVKVVYANTMEHGLTGDNVPNGFWPYRALYWLKGVPSFGEVAFSNPSPLPAGTEVYSRWDTNSAQVAEGWAGIDFLLKTYQQPVVMRTDLGVGTARGDGHFIVLLGVGHNDDLPALYGSGHSGDYYIVGDPAGHFQTNPNDHYGQVNYLSVNDEGANYGGWFAIYPKEDLVNRITRHGSKEISAVTIGKSSGPRVRWTARSPVTLMITDAYGNQSGIGTNGNVLGGIPDSFFEPAIAEEEYGDSTLFPAGAKSVEVDNAEGGIYQVDLIGTGTGDYQLDFDQTDAAGARVGTNTLAGTVTLGQHITYTFSVAPTGPPSLHFGVHSQALVFLWPTNAVGFSLQTTTNVADPAGWAPAANNVTVVGSLNRATNSLAGPRRFFRLKK